MFKKQQQKNKKTEKKYILRRYILFSCKNVV